MGDQTYHEFIDSILQTRGRFNCGDAYHERHHIRPKSLGGTNEKENLIDLYAREHFVAHKLLASENPDNTALARAYAIMAFMKNGTTHQRYECTPEEYECARVFFSSTIQSLYSDVKNHPCYGKHASAETRKKMSDAAKERLKDPTKNGMYGRRGIDNPNYGRHCSEEMKAKLSKATKERMAHTDFTGEKNPRAKSVIRLSDGKIYACGKYAAEENGILYSTLKTRCRRRNGFMYYQDYLDRQNDLEEQC